MIIAAVDRLQIMNYPSDIPFKQICTQQFGWDVDHDDQQAAAIVIWTADWWEQTIERLKQRDEAPASGRSKDGRYDLTVRRVRQALGRQQSSTTTPIVGHKIFLPQFQLRPAT
jgi:hypothetical protein